MVCPSGQPKFEHLFDDDGILYAYTDVQTGTAFSSELMNNMYLDLYHVPDPVHYWSNEDSMQYSGLLLYALYEKYVTTRDPSVIERMDQIYRGVRKVYDVSQRTEPGSFSRPYGGLSNMTKYNEPLGTDQAGSLFWGLWLYGKVADQSTRAEIDEMNIRTVDWYREQDYSYLYYQFHVHGSRGDEMRYQGHSLCYYLPSLLWAYQVTGEVVYYDDYVRLWEEQWYECDHRLLLQAWKHRFLLRWLRDLAPEKAFWQRFYERVIHADIQTFRGAMDPRWLRESSDAWHSAPIAANGFAYEWPEVETEEFEPGLVWQEDEWFPDWRSASRERKAEMLAVWDGSAEIRRSDEGRSGWFPGYKTNSYRHRAQFIPVNKIRDVTMAIVYDTKDKVLAEKVAGYLAKYDRIELHTLVIDPDHTLIPEEDIQHYARSLSSAFPACWLAAYWMLQRLEWA